MKLTKLQSELSTLDIFAKVYVKVGDTLREVTLVRSEITYGEKGIVLYTDEVEPVKLNLEEHEPSKNTGEPLVKPKTV